MADGARAGDKRDLFEIAVEGEQGAHLRIVAVVAFVWVLFQLWYASPLPFMLDFGIIRERVARPMHLGFALILCFLMFRSRPVDRRADPTVLDWSLLGLGAFATFYLAVMWDQLSERPGIPFALEIGGMSVPIEFYIGLVGILVLLEAVRRSVGLPLVIIALVFFAYSVFGPHMPTLIAHKGVSLERLVGYHWFGGEAIFGLALDVSLDTIFLFVLFGALLDRAGAGKYFLDLAFSTVGKYRGGPAKASILASGLTGLVSGSSVANVVTTGTFTIPIMKKVGMSAEKAGAIEVAASVNGQLMPPIMGAAAFVMAEFIGISYFEVVYHAFLPAIITYLALLWVSHIEALKLDLKPLDKSEIPSFWPAFMAGVHYWIPIGLLVYLLIVARYSAQLAVFYSVLVLFAIIFVQEYRRHKDTETPQIWLRRAIIEIFEGCVAGGRNMATVAVAIAAAGIVIGSVNSTGLSNALVGFVEVISGGNIAILLMLTAVLCLLLGMGLPTTANYLVVASILAPVIVDVGSSAGLVVPLIVVHLFVFYFGLMADVTPPVALAAYAAAGISRGDPVKTGVQAFTYEMRTAILPFVFIFNTELVLIGVDTWVEGIFVFFASLTAICLFSAITQRHALVRMTWIELAVAIVAMLLLFCPGYFLDRVIPPYTEVALATATDPVVVAPDQEVRLRIIRETPFGDRKRVIIFTGDEIGGTLTAQSLGIEVEPGEGSETIVSTTTFMGVGETKGLEALDRIIRTEVETQGRPMKYWFSLLGFAILAPAVVVHLRRYRRKEAGLA